jgi:hypothetical protein
MESFNNKRIPPAPKNGATPTFPRFLGMIKEGQVLAPIYVGGRGDPLFHSFPIQRGDSL